jgi:hypothetical protein
MFILNTTRKPSGRDKIAVVSVKAFGDLVIAMTCCARAHDRLEGRLSIMLGSHLLPLYEALGSPLPFTLVEHGSPRIPALFEIRTRGPLRALKSAAAVRRAFDAAHIPKGTTLLFDRRGVRENYITRGSPFEVIPREANIYRAYDTWFNTVDDKTGISVIRDGPIRIFPGSRMPAKNLPLSLVRDLIAVVDAKGLSVELMLLEGERPDLEVSNLPHSIVPRHFRAMIDAVEGASVILGADSMPVHIAEHVGCPAFVFSPVNNRYWLPLTAYAHDWCALFDEGVRSSRLAAFLDWASQEDLGRLTNQCSS